MRRLLAGRQAVSVGKLRKFEAVGFDQGEGAGCSRTTWHRLSSYVFTRREKISFGKCERCRKDMGCDHAAGAAHLEGAHQDHLLVGLFPGWKEVGLGKQ